MATRKTSPKAQAEKPAARKPAAKSRAPARKAPAKKPAKPKAAKPAAEAKAKKPGPAPTHPVEQTAEDIKVMVACGFEHSRIARILKISTATMHKHYKDELELGGDIANFEIGGTIYREAKKGEKWAASLWAARRMDWAETVNHQGTLTVNRVNLRAPDMQMPEEDPGEAYGTEDEEFDLDDFDEDE